MQNNLMAIVLVAYWIGALMSAALPIKDSPNSAFILAIVGIAGSFATAAFLDKD